jgi:hypothetical protein
MAGQTNFPPTEFLSLGKCHVECGAAFWQIEQLIIILVVDF